VINGHLISQGVFKCREQVVCCRKPETADVY